MTVTSKGREPRWLHSIAELLTEMMPLTPCSCACGIHDALRKPVTMALSIVESNIDTEPDVAYTEQDECQDDVEEAEIEDEDAPLAIGSPRYEAYDEEYHATMAMERDEADAVVTSLQLQVRALRKYKSNYELLCGQLGELNAQIGLQLQRHEADVAALQASIADLQTEKIALDTQVSEAQQALAAQRDAARQDREYSEHVHCQLSTAAELLKATEIRLEQQEGHFTEEFARLKSQHAAGDEERAKSHATAKGLEEELKALQARETASKEQELKRRRHKRSKHKKELMARAAKLRAVSYELEGQRSALRATKKQLAQVQADNDALRKQLANLRRDGAHLSDFIHSQRVEQESYADELSQAKKAKKKLAKRLAILSQETEQLQNGLSDAKEELLHKNDEHENCRKELKGLRTELRQTSQALDEVQCSYDKMMKQVATRQTAENEQRSKAKENEQEQRASCERRYRKELNRMRDLLADNHQRATESSKDVQKLRRELLGVQKLLHGCTEERDTAPEPIDQWAEVMRDGVKAEESVLKSAIMDQVRAFGA